MRLPLLCLLAALFLAPLRAAEPQPQGAGRKAQGEGAPAGGKPLAPSGSPSPSALRPSPSASPAPFFQPGDVIALVGGEDMVVASEYGYLELLLLRALPDYRLRFRNLAWEGDTVFEQRRDLNFPSWEEQLDKIGATVVICQFGQMESLMSAGREGSPSLPAPPAPANGERSASVPYPGAGGAATAEARARAVAEFSAAYEKLIERFSAGGKRRVALLQTFLTERNLGRKELRVAYTSEIQGLAKRLGLLFADTGDILVAPGGPGFLDGYAAVSSHLMFQFEMVAPISGRNLARAWTPEDEPLRAKIIAKNKLWFDYWRPQNWAFLAGDRTAQPSSRDHLDPSKRWFPPEREAFLPLLEAREKEIDALARQLAAGK